MIEAIKAVRPGMAFWSWLILVTVVAAGLRLGRLDAPSLWIDELFSVRDAASLAQSPWSNDLPRMKRLSFVPTAIGLWASGVTLQEVAADDPASWRALGIREASMRMASCLIGILSVPLLALASCRLLGLRGAGVLALLIALSPWHIYWSQANRFYSMQFLFYNLALILYFTGTRTCSWRRLVTAMILIVLAAFTQATALVFAFVIAGDWVISRIVRDPAKLGAAGYAAVIIAFALILTQLGLDTYAARDGVARAFSAGGTSPTRIVAGAAYLVGPAVVVFALVTAWSLRTQQPRLSSYLLLAAVLPIAVFSALSMRKYAGTRYTFVCLYAWLAIAAIGIDQAYQLLRPRLGRTFAYAPLLLLLAPMVVMNASYFTHGKGFHPRWRAAYAYVAAHRQPGELVAATSRVWVGRYYLEDSGVHLLEDRSDGLDGIETPTWLVAAKSRSQHERLTGEGATLEARFETWSVVPLSSISVYYYDPAAASATRLSRATDLP